MQIQDNKTLHKIISLQSCVIQGRNINAMLHKDKNYYRKMTQADFIAVYVNENEKIKLEYILEDHHEFHNLAEKYIFTNNNLLWESFTKNCHDHFMFDNKYYHATNFHELFKGFISQKKALDFTKELKLKDAITMPIYAYDNTQVIGYICFMFKKKVNINIKKLEETKAIFETLLQPLHDKHYNILYTKCIRVDENFKLLTEKEKRIVKKVISGKSYPEIAEYLNLSINTIKTHMKNIFNKYHVNSKIELYKKLNG
ncbi:MAG: helix-turn-helix transcriptional regulator [Bacteroidota bacterium]